MRRVAIYELEYNRPGRLIAHVDGEGKVTPDDETTAGVRSHVQRMLASGLTGTALLDRLERSYTNGYIMARIVEDDHEKEGE